MDVNRKDLDNNQVECAKNDLIGEYPQSFNYYNYDKCFPDAPYVSVSTIIGPGGHAMAVVNVAGDTYEETVEKSKTIIKSINSAIPMNIVKMGKWFPVNINSAHLSGLKKHLVSKSDTIRPPNSICEFNTEDVEKAILRNDVEYLASDDKKIDDIKRNAKKQNESMKMKLESGIQDDEDEVESLCVDITKLVETNNKISELSKTLVNLFKRSKILASICTDKKKRNPNWYQHYRDTHINKYNYIEEDIRKLDELEKVIDYISSFDDKLILDININTNLELAELKKEYTALIRESLDS